MNWLVAIVLSILKPFGGWLFGVFAKDILAMASGAFVDWQARRQAAQKAKEASDSYKAELKKAGDDEQAQKDAADKFLNSTK